jgi:prolyl oligopeptidase
LHVLFNFQYVTNEDGLFTFRTNLNAPNYKLIKIDISNSEKSNWIDFLNEKPDVLQSVSCVDKNKLLVNYLHDCKDKLNLFDLKTAENLYAFPIDIGTLLEISSKFDQNFASYFQSNRSLNA